MHVLIVDIGNTRAKLAVYSGGERQSPIVAVEYEMLDREAILLCEDYSAEACMVSSVGRASIALSLEKSLSEVGVVVKRLTPSSPVPSCLGALHPELGADRLAAVVAGVTEFPGCEVLIVDAGTAITYEYISADGRYMGGNISPGVQTRFRSLHEFTSLLPQVSPADYDGGIGYSTKTAIAAGVLDGFRYEVSGAIDAFLSRKVSKDTVGEKKSHKKVVILTGGDHKYLVLKVKSCIFARPNLVLDGIAIAASAAFGTHFD